MFAQVQFPTSLYGEELDTLLSQGWFRMGQSVFTTNFLHFKSEFYSAIWLRVDLKTVTADRTQSKLFRQNSRFTWKVGKALVDEEKEELFQRYRKGITFETSPSLRQLLFGKFAYNIYDSYEVLVHDEGKLIAAGYFDFGKNSSAGIISIYDPAYKKFSLGKFLIYLKIEYCVSQGLNYFYPGYFVPGYPFFDYKLGIGKNAIEFFDVIHQKWLPISFFQKSPLNLMMDKLREMQTILRSLNIECGIYKYEFFDANLFPELKDAELFDFPLFLNCFSFNQDIINPFIVFDILSDKFRLLQCMSLWTSNLPAAQPDIYSYHLLKVEFEYCQSGDPAEIVKKLFQEVKS